MESQDALVRELSRIAGALERIEEHLRPTVQYQIHGGLDIEPLELLSHHDQDVATKMPKDLWLSPPMIEYVRAQWKKKRLGVPTDGELADLFEEFCIHHRKKGSKFKNWMAVWQTWVRNDIKFKRADAPRVEAGPRGRLL